MDRAKVEAALAVIAAETRAENVTLPAVEVRHIWRRFKGIHRGDHSWRLVRNLLRPFVVAFARVPADSLAPEAWEAHRAKRGASRTRCGRPPCDLTLNLELLRAKQLLRFGGLSVLDDCKPVATRVHRETWLTWPQVQELLRGAGYLRWGHQVRALRAWILVAVMTGMRGGEIRRLRWDRIGPDGVVALRASETKTRKRRVVVLPGEALEALLCLPRGENTHVFENGNTARPYNLTTVRAWFRQAAEAVGLDRAVADGDVRLVPHDLRHSAASLADAAGARATAIRDLLGHADLRTTARYLHRDAIQGAREIALLLSPPRRGPKKSEKIDMGVLDKRAEAGGRVFS